MSVQVSGTYDQALAFTKAVQSGDRLFLVDAITASTSSQDSSTGTTTSGAMSWTLGGDIYVLASTASGAKNG
ncbi:hypothetical protein DEI82_12145 [Curtobacterium sp. MCBD17_019]|nr:hypothetical protein DEI82_12145 [Curtobacterium sp. MCBD17_019]